MPRSKFRIAMIPSQNAGVNYYRLATWAFEMRKYRNVEVALFAFQYDMIEIHPWQRDFLQLPQVQRQINSLCEIADLVIWHPVHYDYTMDFVLQMRHRHGKPMVVETDDNYIDVPPCNEAFRSFSPGTRFRQMAVHHLRSADAVVVTTPYLKATYQAFNPEVHVLENALDFKGDSRFVGWDQVSVKKHKGIRIGWIGGRTHFDDLMLVAPALREILIKHPQVTLCLVNSALKDSCEALGKKYPFDGLKNVQIADRSVPINRYAKFMAHFGFDIGIAPLVDCNFNRAKSNLRWLEYSALKIPTVASKVGHFDAATIRHGQDGFLAASDQEWFDQLDALVQSEQLRERTGLQAYRRVKADFNVKRNAANYLRLLKKIAEFNPDMEEQEEWTLQPSERSLAI